MSTWEIRYRDMYEKYTTTTTVKSKAGDPVEACRKVKSRLIGWGNCAIMNITEIRKDGTCTTWVRPYTFREV